MRFASLFFICALLVRITSFIFATGKAYAQNDSVSHRKTTVDIEIRPRAEFRNNYVLQPADSHSRDLSVSQRNRFGITHLARSYKLHASLQEIHLWENPVWRPGSISIYELYVEPALSKSMFIRIGRQAVSLDNGRLFSAAPWSQQSRAHEGVRLFLTSGKGVTDFTLAFTRKYSDYFDPAYSPLASNNYQFLFVHHTRHRINDRYTLTFINSSDLFENATAAYLRFTCVTRIEYSKNNLYLTLNSSYQLGENENFEKIRAWYLQPEVRYNMSRFSIRLGAEMLSGNDSVLKDGKTHSFVPLYGVAWKFMGNMNLFTRFPADVKDRGLLDPYLFSTYTLSNKLAFRADFHLFFLQHHEYGSRYTGYGRYLGFENDLSAKYNPLPGVDIDLGFSWLAAKSTITRLGKVKDASKIPVWSYLMLSFQPASFSWAGEKRRHN